MLKIITSKYCPPCKVLKMILEKNNIEYEEIPIDSKEGLKIAEKVGVTAVPIVIKDDKPIMIGVPASEQEVLRRIR